MKKDLNLNFEMMLNKTLDHVFFDSSLIKEIKRDVSVSNFSYQLRIIYLKIEHFYIRRLFCERIALFKETFENFFNLSLSKIFINGELIDFHLLSKISETNNPYAQGTTLEVDKVKYRLLSQSEDSESIFIPNDMSRENNYRFIDFKKKHVTLRFYNSESDKVIIIPLNINEIEIRRYYWYTIISLPTIIFPIRFFNKYQTAKFNYQKFANELTALKEAEFFPLGEETEFFLNRFSFLEIFEESKR